SGANCSFNTFVSFNGLYLNSPALNCINSDSNTFIASHLFRAPGGTANCIALRAGATSTLSCRSSLFNNLSPGVGGVLVEGTNVAAVPSVGNSILFYDKNNGAPDPTLGTGATLFWTSNTGNISVIPPIVIGA